MKYLVKTFAAIAMAILKPMTLAQSTIYVSTLGGSVDVTNSVASDSWRAASFITGTNAAGYILNSVQLLMRPASGNPNDFRVMLYSADADGPGSSLGNLTGPAPVTGGLYTYEMTGITLSAVTPYFVVLTAGTFVVDGSYNWSIANSFNHSVSGGWRLGGGYFGSPDGLSWVAYRPNPFQFAIEAAAVPEPSPFTLVSLGLVGLIFWRHKRRLAKRPAGTESARV